MTWRKIRPDIPGLDEMREAVTDHCLGAWNKRELIEMNARFCAAIQRAHPELLKSPARAEPERRRA